MNNRDLQALDQHVDDLVALCQKLQKANRQLRCQAIAWQTERAALLEQQHVARTKVQALIDRLKASELTA